MPTKLKKGKKKKRKKNERKREGTIATIFFHTCASKQHHDLHDRESPILSLSYNQWSFILHDHLVFFLSFHTLIALVHLLHGNPYSLTLISIDGHLHSLLIRLVDVRLSSPFSLQPPPYSIPPIVLYPWLTLMYCVRVEKV